MREHELTSDTNVAIFHVDAAESLFSDLDKKVTLQRQFLSRLHSALESVTPETYVEKPFQGVDHVSQFRAGNAMRGYCVFADEPPEYNIFYFLEVTDHDYDAYPVAKYDRKAESVLEKLRTLSNVEATEAYLESQNALESGDVETLLNEI